MKALKFFAVLVAAFAMLVACEPKGNEVDNGGGQLEDSLPSTPKDSVETPVTPAEKVIIHLNWGAATDVNGKTFEVGMGNYDELTYEMVLPVALKNTTAEDKTFAVKEVRKYDLKSALASLCVDKCMGGDMTKAEQEWAPFVVKAGAEVEVALHLTPLVSEATIFPAEFTFSDGTEEVKFAVNYNYTPAQ